MRNRRRRGCSAIRILRSAIRHGHPPELFEISDPREPSDWVSEIGEAGERYAYPSALNVVGFFEDFFDDQRQAVATFWQVVNQRLALAVV